VGHVGNVFRQLLRQIKNRHQHANHKIKRRHVVVSLAVYTACSEVTNVTI
jgi:hypothetical protein